MNMDKIKAQFPVFQRPNLKDALFLDGAAGTQVCQRAVDASLNAMITHNSNLGGFFSTSVQAVDEVAKARQAAADLFNARSSREIIFGQNMTTLTFAMSRCIGRTLQKGDEIVLTHSDHDANVSPWLQLAEDLELSIRWLPFDHATHGFDIDAASEIISERTRIVALNYANNVTGTINDIAPVCKIAKERGALVYVDAVQFAPHGVIDVQALGCDFLVCSAYKFYGPHHGILWGRLDLLESLKPYKVRPAYDTSPDKFETGTKNRESIAGVLGAIEHIAWIGEQFGGCGSQTSRREKIVAGMRTVIEYEEPLVAQLIEGLQKLPGACVHGYTANADLHRRVPTIAFTVKGMSSEHIARNLAEKNMFVWYGHLYGLETTKALGLLQSGGVVRVSIAQYTTHADIQRFLDALGTLIN
jgi:cysteine desulfurase family protein (TIGR01976 family)